MSKTDLRPANPRMKRKTLYIAATSVCMLAYAGLMLASSAQAWLVWPALGLALLGLVFACFWMASLDEAAQQAHYVAWFWGGSAGLVISMLAFVTVIIRPAAFAAVFEALSGYETFAAGIIVGVMPAVFGYVIWWAALWLRRG